MYKLKTLVAPVILIAAGVFAVIFYNEPAINLLWLIPALIGTFRIATNTEDPIEPGRFIIGIVLCVASAAVLLGLGAGHKFS